MVTLAPEKRVEQGERWEETAELCHCSFAECRLPTSVELRFQEMTANSSDSTVLLGSCISLSSKVL